MRLTCTLLLALASLPTSFAGGQPDPTDWSIGATSSVTLIGSQDFLASQDVGVTAALAPSDWRTVDGIVFPHIDFGLGEFVDLVQVGEALGAYDSATGVATLSLTIRLTDHFNSSATFTVALTTEKTNGTDPDDGPVCLDQGSDPPICQGDRRDPLSGAFRLVAIAAVPSAAGTIVDTQLLRVELAGVIVETDTDGDLVERFLDNCPSDSNAGQQDLDLDAIGNACDDCNDEDRDGFGSLGDPACPGGAATDCDDDDDTVYPNGPEFCDDLDNDCDLASDEAQCAEFDVDLDSFVDGVELAWLGRAFGECSANPAAEWWSAIDIVSDGCIDGDDLALLTVAWGCDPGPICD